jgi:hypothetical protein
VHSYCVGVVCSNCCSHLCDTFHLIIYIQPFIIWSQVVLFPALLVDAICPSLPWLYKYELRAAWLLRLVLFDGYLSFPVPSSSWCSSNRCAMALLRSKMARSTAPCVYNTVTKALVFAAPLPHCNTLMLSSVCSECCSASRCSHHHKTTPGIAAQNNRYNDAFWKAMLGLHVHQGS